jgi:uncharacterized protein (DUF2342 family)
LTHITHREPRRAAERVEQLFALLEQHGDEVMRAAIDDAIANETLSVAAVRRGLPAPAECRPEQLSIHELPRRGQS